MPRKNGGRRTYNAEVHILQLIVHTVRSVTVLSIMTLTVDGHERSIMCPRRYSTEGPVAPKAVHDAVVKREIYKRAYNKSILSHPLCGPLLY
jgi:hypothetical protein